MTFVGNIKRHIKQMLDIASITLTNYRRFPPIIIYQMGKVGSSTVFSSLKQSDIQNPVIQIHFLSKNGIEEAEAYFQNLPNPVNAHHIQRSKTLREKIIRNRFDPNLSWRIVTLVRDPIAREISDFFQNINLYHPELFDQNAKLDENRSTKLLCEILNNFNESADYACTWFDKELKAVFDIDVFSYPFDTKKGYSIMEKGNVKVLCIRLEDLDTVFGDAMTRLLSKKLHFTLHKKNIGQEKPLSESLKVTLEKLVLPNDTYNKIYSSRFVRHFYSQDMIDSFIAKWRKLK